MMDNVGPELIYILSILALARTGGGVGATPPGVFRG